MILCKVKLLEANTINYCGMVMAIQLRNLKQIIRTYSVILKHYGVQNLSVWVYRCASAMRWLSIIFGCDRPKRLAIGSVKFAKSNAWSNKFGASLKNFVKSVGNRTRKRLVLMTGVHSLDGYKHCLGCRLTTNGNCITKSSHCGLVVLPTLF